MSLIENKELFAKLVSLVEYKNNFTKFGGIARCRNIVIWKSDYDKQKENFANGNFSYLELE